MCKTIQSTLDRVDFILWRQPIFSCSRACSSRRISQRRIPPRRAISLRSRGGRFVQGFSHFTRGLAALCLQLSGCEFTSHFLFCGFLYELFEAGFSSEVDVSCVLVGSHFGMVQESMLCLTVQLKQSWRFAAPAAGGSSGKLPEVRATSYNLGTLLRCLIRI